LGCGTILVYTESIVSCRPLSLRMATATEIEQIRNNPDPETRQLWNLAEEFVAQRRKGLRRVGQG